MENNKDIKSHTHQPCWDCKKAYGQCNWSRDFTPVEGWIATHKYYPPNKYYKKVNGKSILVRITQPQETYEITYCPEFELEERETLDVNEL